MQSHAEIQKALADCDAEYGKLIPAALAREQEIRATAFYEKTFTLAGFPCRALTLADYRLLTEAGNVFFSGRDNGDQMIDCGQVLWLLSVDFKEDKAARDKFMARVFKSARKIVIKEVRDYLSSIWQDMPDYKIKDSGASPRWCYEASIIDSLAARYGWNVEYVLGLPLAQVRAFLNIIYCENCAKAGKESAFQAPPSKQMQSEWLRERNDLAARQSALNQTSTSTA